MSRALILALALLASPARAETRYFSVIEDLPLPPGFAESASASFDASGGRIVTAEAMGGGELFPVRDFYLAALPPLGWSISEEDSTLVFLRGRERLTFSVERTEGHISLRAQLVVRPASMRAD